MGLHNRLSLIICANYYFSAQCVSLVCNGIGGFYPFGSEPFPTFAELVYVNYKSIPISTDFINFLI